MRKLSVPNPKWTSSLYVLTIVFFLLNLGYTVGLNSLSVYVSVIGKPAAFTGILSLAFSICSIVGRIYGGYLSDRLGKLIILCVGLFVLALTTAAYGFAVLSALLIALRCMHGFGNSFANTAATALCTELVPPGKTGEGLGLFYIGQGVAMGIGATVITLLTMDGSYTMVFAGAGAFVLLALLLTLLCRRMLRSSVKREKKSLPKWNDLLVVEAMPAAWILFLLSMAFSAVMSYLLLFAKDNGVENPGAFFLVCAAAMIACNVFGPRIASSRGTLSVLLPAFAAGLCGCIILAWSNNTGMFLLSAGLIGICTGVGFPVINTLALRSVPLDRIGSANGTYLIASDLGTGLGALTWGVLIDIANYTTVYLCAAACMAAAAGFSIWLVRRGNKGNCGKRDRKRKEQGK